MPMHSTITPKPLLLAIFITGSIVCCAAQTQTAPATAPAPKAPAAAHAKAAAPAVPVLKTAKDKVSYAIGADLGGKLKSQSIAVDPALLSRGLRDALAG